MLRTAWPTAKADFRYLPEDVGEIDAYVNSLTISLTALSPYPSEEYFDLSRRGRCYNLDCMILPFPRGVAGLRKRSGIQ